MDWGSLKQEAGVYWKKYRLAVLILLAGLMLMLLPGGRENGTAPAAAPVQKETREEALQRILSCIDGAGKVAVLLTESRGEEVLYQTDEEILTTDSSRDERRKTVMTSDSAREQTGLIQRVDPPILLGAVVVCQGADRPKVKLAVTEAVMCATGLPSNCITVLKMK